MTDYAQKLDRAIFNRHGKAVPAYQGAANICTLPVIGGFILGIVCFFMSLFASRNAAVNQFELGCLWGIPLVLLNEIIFMKNVFILPGLFRKFFYPIFIAVISGSIFTIVYCGTVATCWLIFGILIAVIVGAVLGATSNHKSTPSGPAFAPSSPSSSPDDNIGQRVVIPDGYSGIGTTLTQQDGCNWKGDDGNMYERNMDGSFTKKQG